MTQQFRFAFCNEGFQVQDPAAICQLLKGLGYAGVELAPFTMRKDKTRKLTASNLLQQTAEQAARWVEAAGENNLEIVGLHWLGVEADIVHFTSTDVEVQTATEEYMEALVELCKSMGGSVLVLGSPKQRAKPMDISKPQAVDVLRCHLQEAGKIAARRGVQIALEPLGTDETDIINSCAEAVGLINRVNSPAVGLHLDVKAICAEFNDEERAEGVPTVIGSFGNRALHFHANDRNRRGPGLGDTDFAPIFSALKKSGYGGWVSVEAFEFAPDAETVAKSSIDYMKRCLAPEQPSNS